LIRHFVACVAVFFVAGVSWQVAAEEPAAPKGGSGSSLDAQLLEDLNRELLEGLNEDAEPESPSAKPPGPAPARQEGEAPRPEPAESVGEDIGAPDVAADDENPLLRIEQKMRQVEERLAGLDPSDQTQSLQRQIAEELAALLEQMKQQQQNQNQNNQNSQQQQQQQPQPQQQQDQQKQSASNRSNQPANKPARDSEERQGKIDQERIKPEDLRDLISRPWGHLPEQVREQMETKAQDQFLPKYETLIEDYYKRLAEEAR
jgi:hypothetical protein